MTKVDELLVGCASWSDFVAAVSPLSEKEKGTCFERLVELFLQLDPIYLTKLAKIWRYKDVPYEIRQELKLPLVDTGIDIVARTHEGEYWAIQAKYRLSEGGSLTFGELSTFVSLAFTVCGGFSFALICTTTERVTRTLHGNPSIGCCTIETWAQLPAEFFDLLRKKVAGDRVVPIPRIPKFHQRRAIENAYEHYVENKKSRGKLIMPCGSGKSLTALWIAARLSANKVAIAVPSLALVKQTLTTWMTEAIAHGDHPDWLCICGDESAGQVSSDDLVSFAHDLGIPCETDPLRIGNHLRAFRRPKLLVVTTYRSSAKLAQAARDVGVSFDLIVFDEAHKLTVSQDSPISALLFDANVDADRRLFMTATERRYVGASDDVVSMDDVDLFGETFDLLTFKEAIEMDEPILCDYRVITIAVRESEIARLIRSDALIRLNPGEWNAISAASFAGLIAVRKAVENLGMQHAISFHSSVRRAKEFTDISLRYNTAFPDKWRLHSFHVSGKMPTGARSAILSAFTSSSPSLVSNARCLSEGVDIPVVDGVVFTDPRGSSINIVQASGRAIRQAPGKSLGYVIVPVILSDNASLETLFESSDFKFVFSVLRALGANDERIIEEFRELSRGTRSQGEIIRFDFDVVLPIGVDADQFIKSVEIRCWEKLAKLAYRPFAEAREFARSLHLNSSGEWHEYVNGKRKNLPQLPKDIPRWPKYNYRAKGWIDWADFLGYSPNGANPLFRPYHEARAFARALKLKTSTEWRKFTDGKMPHKGFLPADIPKYPPNYYPDDWQDWANFLGIPPKPKIDPIVPYEEARAFARSLRLKNGAEWKCYYRGEIPGKVALPSNVPRHVFQAYRHTGWVNWEDFLGVRIPGTRTGRKEGWRKFEEARDFVRSLQLKGQRDWKRYCRDQPSDKPLRPPDIPTAPEKTYAGHDWRGYGDWLGTGTIASRQRQYRPYIQAREFVHHLQLRSVGEWNIFAGNKRPDLGARPLDIPSRPSRTYAEKGWQGWSDWLGSKVKETKADRRKTQKHRFRSYSEAREFARTLGLASSLEWLKYSKGELPEKGFRPHDIPGSPTSVYKNKGWAGWGDFLGTGNIAPAERNFLPFSEARKLARSLGIKTTVGWVRWCRENRQRYDVPAQPGFTYRKEGWISWDDWLDR